MTSVLTISTPSNADVAFDQALMAPCKAYVAHLYDEHGLVFDCAGYQYFVGLYQTTRLVEGCRVPHPRYGSITTLELGENGAHTPWFTYLDKALPWTAEVWGAYEHFLANVEEQACPPEMAEIVTQLRQIVAA